MAGARFGRTSKPRSPLSFCVKVSLVFFLGLSFVVVWSMFFSPSSSISSRRDSYVDEIETDRSAPARTSSSHATRTHSDASLTPPLAMVDSRASRSEIGSSANKEERVEQKKEGEEKKKKHREVEGNSSDMDKPEEVENEKKDAEGEGQADAENEEIDTDFEDGVDVKMEENSEGEGDGFDENGGISDKKKRRKTKKLGPLFDPKARYEWKLCGGRNKQSYVPCIDMEGTGGRRHHERSCPHGPVTCLVPLPKGYKAPMPWPESKFKILYRNVAHPKLSAFLKTKKWMNVSGEYLIFPSEESELKGGVQHYLDSIEEMVPDIEWGKTIRVILDIGCSDASLTASLLDRDVITLSLGLMNDQIDLAQVVLERGMLAVVGNLGTRRLPFPSGVFDAVHCSACKIHWHSNGGRLLLEMNRILRPGGYFMLSTVQGDAESEEGISALTASICWNVLAHKTDEISELGVKIYQRPASNDIYELRRKNEPPFCKDAENQDYSWYTPLKACLHKLPAAIEERGTDWPEEWPKRLDTFPEWLGDLQAKIIADNEHWKAIISRSYLIGMGIDWSKIRNIMDMKAIYGGFAAGLQSQKVWVMNVVPVHAPNTLPIIFERGLVGIYHDWCEPFSTYPRSYDLLHADHLFSRLKNRCKQPIVIVVEMDRILRPGGWVIIRDKLEILNPLENIFKTMHWDITLTFSKEKEGIMCVQKTMWRPQT
ncbi:putative methyltransferase PMT28 [Apostasia shenzhenica]|uniref:Methyltransferase n=1 Tax=Apostasia shenzhenica TaxID=1088818 RepID=A0A2H9ZW15_9ASPA|nr:putative methyltransferase PMT28 [Apostasia shenzhenica]